MVRLSAHYLLPLPRQGRAICEGKKTVPITAVNLVRAITNFFPTQGNFYACTFSPADRLAYNSRSLNSIFSFFSESSWEIFSSLGFTFLWDRERF